VTHVLCRAGRGRRTQTLFTFEGGDNIYGALGAPNACAYALTPPTRHRAENLWIHDVTNSSIVFLNRGAHFQANTSRILSQLRVVFTYLQVHIPGALVFYRATNIPVPTDQFTNEPSKAPLSLEALLNATGSNSLLHSYGWLHFSEQNAQVRRLVREEFPHVVYLDIEYLSRFRTDSNRDALHSCVPGVTSTWWALFTHALMRVNEQTAE
jgi:hypothetical protein